MAFVQSKVRSNFDEHYFLRRPYSISVNTYQMVRVLYSHFTSRMDISQWIVFKNTQSEIFSICKSWPFSFYWMNTYSALNLIMFDVHKIYVNGCFAKTTQILTERIWSTFQHCLFNIGLSDLFESEIQKMDRLINRLDPFKRIDVCISKMKIKKKFK